MTILFTHTNLLSYYYAKKVTKLNPNNHAEYIYLDFIIYIIKFEHIINNGRPFAIFRHTHLFSLLYNLP